MLWPIKINLSYTIIFYHVLMWFVYNGCPPTAMNAVLAIIADGRRAIVVIDTEGEEINYFLYYFIDSDKTLRRRPRPTPSEEAPGGGVYSCSPRSKSLSLNIE
jgi:hypothetical protein